MDERKTIRTLLLGWDPMLIDNVEIRKKTLAGLEELEIRPDCFDACIEIIATDKDTGEIEGVVWTIRNPSREINDVLLFDNITDYMTGSYNFHMCAAAFYRAVDYRITVVNTYGTPVLQLEYEV